jgi:hypothetical protein
MLPSDILKHAGLRPRHFGVDEALLTDDDGTTHIPVDQPGNVVYNTVAAARLAFDEIVKDQSDEARAEVAFTYFALAKLFGVLADRKAQHVGLATGRGGQVSTPIGSHAELMKAAARNYQEAKNLYPDAPWPPLDGEASGGSVKVPRSYVP